MVEEDEGPAAEKRKQELKGEIDYKFIQFDDLPRAFGEGVEGLYAQPIIVLAGGLTDDDKPGALIIDAANRLETVSSQYGIGSGGMRNCMGEFTKSASGTTGGVQFLPHADDILYFLYGTVTIGGTHAGAASPLYAGISCGTTGFLMQLFLYDATADVDEVFRIPGLGEAAGISKMSGIYNPLQCMMVGSGNFTEDGPGSSGAKPRFLIEYETMANTETYSYDLYFFSVNDSAVTSTAVAGAIAAP